MVKVESKNGFKIEFTEEEIYILSDGLLSLIQRTGEALKIVSDRECQKVLMQTSEKYLSLNSKICRLLQGGIL